MNLVDWLCSVVAEGEQEADTVGGPSSIRKKIDLESTVADQSSMFSW